MPRDERESRSNDSILQPWLLCFFFCPSFASLFFLYILFFISNLMHAVWWVLRYDECTWAFVIELRKNLLRWLCHFFSVHGENPVGIYGLHVKFNLCLVCIMKPFIGVLVYCCEGSPSVRIATHFEAIIHYFLVVGRLWFLNLYTTALRIIQIHCVRLFVCELLDRYDCLICFGSFVGFYYTTDH